MTEEADSATEAVKVGLDQLPDEIVVQVRMTLTSSTECCSALTHLLLHDRFDLSDPDLLG